MDAALNQMKSSLQIVFKNLMLKNFFYLLVLYTAKYHLKFNFGLFLI